MAPKRTAPKEEVKQGELAHRHTDAQVSRLINERFSYLSHEERTIKKSDTDNRTLEETLIGLKRERKLVGGRLSPRFRDSLKTKFRASSSATGSMQMDKRLSVRKSLQDAMALLQHDNPTKQSRVPLIAVLDLDPQLNSRHW